MARLLDNIVTDDLDVAIDPETYQDQTSPAPPAAGTYTFKVKKMSVRKDKDGKIVLRDGQWPVYVLEMVEIVEPTELARGLGLFQDLGTRPFDRNGTPAMEIADFLRAVDQSISLRGLTAIDEAVAEITDGERTFHGRLDWTAYDSAYVKAALADVGLDGVRYADMSESEKKTANGIYRKAKLTGMKKFVAQAEARGSKVAHLWVGPSGETVEVRPKIVQFIPSLEDVRLIAA